MANIRQAFNTMVDGGLSARVVQFNSIYTTSEYETIRTRLATLWREHKEILVGLGDNDDDPMCKLALCGTYHKDAGIARFFLGKSRRRVAKQYSFQVVDSSSDNEQLVVPKIEEAVNDEQSILAQIS